MRAMKLFFLIMLTHVSLYALHSEEAFLQANQKYEQGEYQEALELYNQVKNPGFAVLYNMALACSMQKKYPQAIVYLLKAERIASWKQLDFVYDMLEKVQNKLGVYTEKSWQRMVVIFFKKCILTFSILLIQILLFFCMLLVLISLYMRWGAGRMGMWLLLMLMTVSLFGVWYAKMHYMHQQQGVILKNTQLKAGPELTFYTKDDMKMGIIVTILQRQYDFYQVRCGSLYGWITAENIGVA